LVEKLNEMQIPQLSNSYWCGGSEF